MTKRIDAPVETVFEVASDLAHAAEHIRGIERIELLTPGPVGAGTRWRETRRMMGREATETIEFTAFDRPRSYTAGCSSCGAYVETTFRFAPAGGAADLPGSGSATDLTLDVRCEARSLFARLMSPLTNRMFAKLMRGCMEDDLDDLQRVAEARVSAHS
jgi:hypothetical protein